MRYYTANPSLLLLPTPRRLRGRHPAERPGRAALLQAALGQRGAGGAGQRPDPAVVPHGLPAPAPPGPPVGAAPAVRQPAGGAGRGATPPGVRGSGGAVLGGSLGPVGTLRASTALWR